MALTPDSFKNLINLLTPVDPGQSVNPQKVATTLIAFLLELSMYVFLLAFLASGMIWLFSLGSPERVQAAKKSFLYSIIGLLIIVSAFAVLSFITNQLGFLDVTSGSSVPTLPQIVTKIFSFAIPAAAVGFLFLLLFAGVRYMLSGGDEEAAAAARRQMVDALIGLILTLSAFAIGRAIIELVGFANKTS
jgi:hypothetical protein